MKHFLKSTPHSTLLFHHENTTEKYHFSNNSGSIYLHACVCSTFPVYFHFFFRKCSLVWYALKHGVATQPFVAFWTFKFHSCCFVYSRARPAPSSLPFHRPMFAVSCVKSVIWLIDGTCLLCLVVWVQGTHPISYIRSVTIVSFNGWCDNFELQEARMKTLLRIVNSRRCKKWLICLFLGLSANAVKVYHVVIFVYILDTSTYYSLLLWLASEIFHSHHRNYPLLVEKACLSVCLHVFCPSTPWLSGYP